MSHQGRDSCLKGLLYGYVEYRREIGDLRQKLRDAEASSALGKSAELGLERRIADVTEELAAEGIID